MGEPAVSEQEWRDALFKVRIVGSVLQNEILAAIAPLIERERQEARQEALAEVAERLTEAARGTSENSPFGRGWITGLRAARNDVARIAAAGGVS